MKTFEMKTVIHFGDNSLDRLAELPYKKVLVITDPFICKRGNDQSDHRASETRW